MFLTLERSYKSTIIPKNTHFAYVIVYPNCNSTKIWKNSCVKIAFFSRIYPK